MGQQHACPGATLGLAAARGRGLDETAPAQVHGTGQGPPTQPHPARHGVPGHCKVEGQVRLQRHQTDASIPRAPDSSTGFQGIRLTWLRRSCRRSSAASSSAHRTMRESTLSQGGHRLYGVGSGGAGRGGGGCRHCLSDTLDACRVCTSGCGMARPAAGVPANRSAPTLLDSRVKAAAHLRAAAGRSLPRAACTQT